MFSLLVCLYTWCVPGTYGGRMKRASDPLDLKLQTVVSHHMWGLELEPRSFGRASSSLNHWGVALAPYLFSVWGHLDVVEHVWRSDDNFRNWFNLLPCGPQGSNSGHQELGAFSCWVISLVLDWGPSIHKCVWMLLLWQEADFRQSGPRTAATACPSF